MPQCSGFGIITNILARQTCAAPIYPWRCALSNTAIFQYTIRRSAPLGGILSKELWTMAKKDKAAATNAFDDVSNDVLERFRDRFDPARVPASLFKDGNDVVHFVHLPKTAGMSVGRSLQDAFDRFYGVAWQDIPRSFRQMTREALYLRTHSPCRQVLMGHYSWTEVSTWLHAELPVKCATIIREPVARAVSSYKYNCSSKHPTRDQFKARFPTIESFITGLPTDFQLTKMIGAFYSFEHALEKLTKYYSFIGLTEALAASLAHFSASHGLPALEEHQINVGERVKTEAVEPKLARMIQERNHNDLRLHALVSSLFTG
jgi:hypothetical protein